MDQACESKETKRQTQTQAVHEDLEKEWTMLEPVLPYVLTYPMSHCLNVSPLISHYFKHYN